MTTNALMTMDQAWLDQVSGMTRKEDVAAGSEGPAVLKINYDEESIHGTGVWVLGQKKDKDGNVVEQGVVVNSMIILATRLQRSYYDEKNVKNSFSSKLFEWGGKAADNADFEAKCAAIGKPEHKGYRIVCFALAIIPDGKLIECVAYFGGTSYIPFKEHYDAITKQKVNGKFYDFPPFVCVTNLPAPGKGKNGARTYYWATLAVGPYLTKEQIMMCGEKREEVYEYIDRLNSQTPQGSSAPQPAAPQPPPGAPMTGTGDFAPEWSAPHVDLGGMKQANATVVKPQAPQGFTMPNFGGGAQPSPASPASPAAQDGGVSDLDLEAAIMANL